MQSISDWQRMKDDAVKMLIQQMPPHPGFEFQPVDYGDYMNLRVFLDNFAGFSEPQRQDLAVWIGSLVKKVRDRGIPCYLEAWERKGFPGKFEDGIDYV